MQSQAKKALIACRNRERCEHFAASLLRAGWDAHTTSNGPDTLDLLRKQRYDAVVMDESLEALSPVEFGLSLRELATNSPPAVVVGGEAGKHADIISQCGPEVAETEHDAFQKLSKLIGVDEGDGDSRA